MSIQNYDKKNDEILMYRLKVLSIELKLQCIKIDYSWARITCALRNYSAWRNKFLEQEAYGEIYGKALCKKCRTD